MSEFQSEWEAVAREYGKACELGYGHVLQSAQVGLLLQELRVKTTSWKAFEANMAIALGLEASAAFHLGHRLLSLNRHRDLLLVKQPSDQFAAQRLINAAKAAERAKRQAGSAG